MNHMEWTGLRMKGLGQGWDFSHFCTHGAVGSVVLPGLSVTLSQIILQQVPELCHPVAMGVTIAAILMIDRVAVTVGDMVTTVAAVARHVSGSRLVAEAVAMVTRAEVHRPGIFSVVTGDIVSTSTRLHLIVQLKYEKKYPNNNTHVNNTHVKC